ncbi:Uncharacterised protein [Burkholderia pseudomallei]|nr:Uncharacterised protein [Burkholderia pseudomallei]CAJ3244116.1 Uncharacterised protein [Burkholderia pseudomallei]CAJ3345108.1 Uncharacterised protein [Burkholderia pseudomallei]CAJ3737430.1 Uncharacterised protein [Burkholderia pseudomallei]CAJ4006389.1 Uncharacterised protein [Burkholderia pseudomallei]
MQAARPVRARWIAVNRISPALWLPRLPRLTAATPAGGDAQCCCTLVRRVYGIRHEILRRRPRRSRRSRRTRNATRTAAAHTRIRSENDACRTVVGGWWLVVGGWWLVVGGWWLVVGGWWLVVGGWWAVGGGRWAVGGGRWHKCLCHSAERRTSAPNAADRRAERRPGRSACGRKPDAKRNRPPVWARAGRRRARWSRRSRRSVDAGPFMPARSMRAQRSEAGHGGVRAARHAHASPGRVLAGFQPSALYSR